VEAELPQPEINVRAKIGDSARTNARTRAPLFRDNANGRATLITPLLQCTKVATGDGFGVV